MRRREGRGVMSGGDGRLDVDLKAATARDFIDPQIQRMSLKSSVFEGGGLLSPIPLKPFPFQKKERELAFWGGGMQKR